MRVERVTVLANEVEQHEGVIPILLKLTEKDIEELKLSIDDLYIPIGAYDVVVNMIKSFIFLAEAKKDIAMEEK